MAKRRCSFCGAEYDGLVLVGRPAMCPTCQRADQSRGFWSRAVVPALAVAGFGVGAWVGWVLVGEWWAALLGGSVLAAPSGLLNLWLVRRARQAQLGVASDPTRDDGVGGS
jgi:hypothetical protein